MRWFRSWWAKGMSDLPKLVRDGIPDIIRTEGRTPQVTVLEGQALRAALLRKLDEECGEVVSAGPDEVLGELADVVEVVRALAAGAGADLATVLQLAEQKRRERGGFGAGWCLHRIDE